MSSAQHCVWLTNLPPSPGPSELIFESNEEKGGFRGAGGGKGYFAENPLR